MSFFAAFVFFIGVAFLVMTVFLNSDKNNIKTAEYENDNKRGSGTAMFTAFFNDDERLFATGIKIDFENKTVEAKEIDIEQTVRGKTLGDIYQTEGDYPFATALSRVLGGGYEKFIKLTAENFQKITDRTHGLVYNDEGVNLLLTGSQAARILDSNKFSTFCESIVQSFLEKDIEVEFLFATENCKNNFSYPNLYKHING